MRYALASKDWRLTDSSFSFLASFSKDKTLNLTNSKLPPSSLTNKVDQVITKQIHNSWEVTFWLHNKGKFHHVTNLFHVLERDTIYWWRLLLSLYNELCRFKSVSAKVRYIIYFFSVWFSFHLLYENYTASLKTMPATSNVTYANNSPFYYPTAVAESQIG